MTFSETIFLFFLALIIFGPKKLPEIARQLGKVLNEFRRASNEFKSQIEQEISHLEDESSRKTLAVASYPKAEASSVVTPKTEIAEATLAGPVVAAVPRDVPSQADGTVEKVSAADASSDSSERVADPVEPSNQPDTSMTPSPQGSHV